MNHDRWPFASWVRRVVALVCASGLGLTVQAQVSGAAPNVYSVPGGVAVSYGGLQGTPSSTRTATVSSSGITQKDNYAFLGPIGAVAAVPATGAGMVAAEAFGWAAVGGVVASWVSGCLGVPLCVGGVAAGAAGVVMMDKYRVRHGSMTDHPTASGLWVDPGTASSTSQGYTATSHGGTVCFAPSVAGLTGCLIGGETAYLQANNPSFTSGGTTYTYSYNVTLVSVSGLLITLHRKVTGVTCSAGSCSAASVIVDSDTTFQASPSSYQQCPAFTDPFDSSKSQAAGAPPGIDGLCPTGRYSQTNEAAVAQMVAAHTPQVDADLQKALQAFNDWAHSGLPCPSCTPVAPTLTGPASIAGVPVTTTTTDASGSVATTVKHDYPITYPAPGSLGNSPAGLPVATGSPWSVASWGDTVTTTTVMTPVGGTATTTTTVTGSSSAATAAAQGTATAEAVTQCDKFPDTLGCAKMGDVPSDTVPKKTSTVTFSAESVGLPSGCPADRVISGKTFSYAAMCDAASNARPWVLVGAVFSSLMLVLMAVRSL